LTLRIGISRKEMLIRDRSERRRGLFAKQQSFTQDLVYYVPGPSKRSKKGDGAVPGLAMKKTQTKAWLGRAKILQERNMGLTNRATSSRERL